MSETTIFIIGAVIFAITVYGSVMGGGLALTRLGANEDETVDRRVDQPEGPVLATDDRPGD